MELRQLEYFVAVADEANFTRAAARLHVTQPGVSAQIRRLEHELGEKLLDRSGRSVRLTEVGAAVLPFARAALNAVDAVRTTVSDFNGLVRGHVAVGMVTSSPRLDVPALLARFNRAHPAVDITLSEDNSDRLLHALRTGTLDMALVGLSTDPPEGIRSQVVVDDALVAAVAPDDPFASRKRLHVDELRERPLISLPHGTGVRGCIDRACAAAGFHPHIAFEASDPDVLVQLAELGLGIAVVPQATARLQRSSARSIAITPRLRSRLDLAWRGEGPLSPAATALVRYTLDAIDEGARGATAAATDSRRRPPRARRGR